MPMPPAKRTEIAEADIARAVAPKALTRRISAPQTLNDHSPALGLRQRLTGELICPADGRRWSPRASLTLAGSVSFLAWGAAALAIGALR
jgi:hypothetical protein